MRLTVMSSGGLLNRPSRWEGMEELLEHVDRMSNIVEHAKTRHNPPEHGHGSIRGPAGVSYRSRG